MLLDNYRVILCYIIICINIYTIGHALKGKKCPKGMIRKKCSGGCPRQCGFWNKRASCRPCMSRCICPSDKYESWDRNLNPVCVKSPDKCRCPDGLVYNKQGSACTKTCRVPYLPPDCLKKKVARCECPKDRPIYHEGRCIKFDQCVCGQGKKGTGCHECNRCFCTNGKLGGCTRKGCPDTRTKEGAKALASGGCYRKSVKGTCIFYNPCPDDYGQGDCKKFPGGTCGCGCKCNKDDKLVCPQTVISCEDSLAYSIMSGAGGWADINGRCTFMLPGPKIGDSSCKHAMYGTMDCDQCNTCECVYGVKVCTDNVCPKPDRGCVLERSYTWRPTRCYYTSPCPQGEKHCNFLFKLPKVTEKEDLDFAYLYNDRHNRCEFMRPSPIRCHSGEELCNECNKCTCSDGKVKCQHNKCGDPVRQGCWTRQSGKCLFTTPCPWDSYGHQCGKKKPPKHEDIIKGGCWSPRYGRCTFYYPCPY